MAQIFFETFNCPAIYFMPTNILALYSTGKTTGLVLDSGHDVTNVMPVFEGYSIREAIQTDLYGGKSIVDHLMKVYEAKVPSLAGNKQVGFKIKENECSVKDIKGKVLVQSSSVYNLPDGVALHMGSELQDIPEQMFKPVSGGYTKKSVQGLLRDSINLCDESLREELLNNILVVGGNTHIPGYCDRLQDEVRKEFKVQTELDTPKDRIFNAWIGGSLFSSLSTFNDTAITRDDYMKEGEIKVASKCLL
jgi:actin-related protein